MAVSLVTAGVDGVFACQDNYRIPVLHRVAVRSYAENLVAPVQDRTRYGLRRRGDFLGSRTNKSATGTRQFMFRDDARCRGPACWREKDS